MPGPRTSDERSLARLYPRGCPQSHRSPLSRRRVRSDTVEWLRNTSKRNEIHGTAKLSGGWNVLIPVQDVVRVVTGLQCLEARE
jgi:hypothetical protein